ncbi:MAG TPA: molybdopterin-dependent oxidoreductase [Candidatus Aquilonibacter sp.]
MSPNVAVHYRACNLCEAICGLQITVEDGRVTDLRGDRSDPFSRGAICPKATALIDLHSDPDRLRTPVRRTSSGFEPIAWDDAFDLVATRLREVESEHGPDSIATYLGNPTVHNSGSMLSSGGFLRALRTRNRYSATSVDQLPHHVAAHAMFGHPMLLPIPDVDRTDYFLIMGANPLVSNGSIMTAPGMRERIRAIRERGGKVVVIDPRRTETAQAADEHLFVRPGTDALFLLALVNVIVSEGLATLRRLEPLIDGYDALCAASAPYTPERVAAHTGIDAARIRRIAREFSAAPSAVAYGRVGLSMQAFGGICQWLVNALNAITGNLDEAGGMMWTLPAFDLLLGAKPGEVHEGRWKSRVRGYAEFNGELPVATLIDEMETPGAGQVRALVVIAGNPMLSTPNGSRLERAIEKLDFVVAIDPYVNETTRHAHVILPPAFGLEVEHYDVVFHALAVRNTARLNEPVFAIAPDARHDWQIFGALQQRMTGKPASPPRERLDAGLVRGPRRTNIEELRAHPHGVDYGALEPCMPQRLLTANGKIALAPQRFLADLARLEKTLDAGVPAFALIGRRQLRGNNSWMHNTTRLMRGADRCTLLVNPADAQRLGIAGGTAVEVTSRNGSVIAPAEITDAIMPGVVSLPHGFGHGRDGVQLRVAREHAGVSINDLTGGAVDEATGNAAFSGIPVTLTSV